MNLRKINVFYRITLIDLVLLLILYMYSMGSSDFISTFSTNAFIVGGVITIVGMFISLGTGEMKEDLYTASMGVETGPDWAGDRTRERSEMRNRQLAESFWIMLVGLPILQYLRTSPITTLLRAPGSGT